MSVFKLKVPPGEAHANGHVRNGDAIDWPTIKALIISRLDMSREYEALGVRFTRPSAGSKGWRECHAYGREDNDPSAAVNIRTGVYKDSGGDGAVLGFFDFALRHKPDFGRWIDCVRHYAAKAGVELATIKTHGKGRVRERVYLYEDAAGDAPYAVFRYIKPNGRKDFTQHGADGRGGWRYGEGAMEGVTPLPYGLPELLAAPDAPVWIVEGEKAVEALRFKGLVATTNHQGADSTDGTWPHFLEYFRGRTCLIVPDNDTVGRKHAAKVADYLRPVAASVKVVELPGLPTHAGLDDWFDAGGELAELDCLATGAVEWTEDVAETFRNRLPLDNRDRRDKRPAGVHVNRHGSAPFVPSVPIVQEEVETEEDWEPLRHISMPKAIEFPIGVFPYPLADLCASAATTMQAPVDYFAVAALGLAGGAIGRSVALRVTTTWDVPSNLYLAIVGPPGSKKSPALKLMAGPLWEIDAELRDTYRAAKKEYRANPDGFDEAPTLGHLTLDDTTREAFAKAHAENPRGLVLIKDELTAWVASLNQYRQGKGDDKQFWMSLNTGSLVKVTRKGSDEPIVIPHPCASVVGCLTPGTLPQMVESRADDGWLDRILFAYPESPEGARVWSWDGVEPDLIDEWRTAIRRLWDRRPVEGDDGKTRPYFVNLGPSARPQWQQFYDAHCAEARAEDFPLSLVSVWSKLEGYALRLALILSRLRQAFDPLGHGEAARDVDALDIIDARRLVDYFKAHVRRARGVIIRWPEGLSHDAREVLRWIAAEYLESFTARDVIRKFRSFDDAYRDDVLRELIRWRYVRLHSKIRRGDHPGRQSSVYVVSPYFITWDKRDGRDNSYPQGDAS